MTNANGSTRRASIVAGLMLASTAVSVLAVPSQLLADTRPAIDLESAVPTAFGDWRLDRTLVPLPLSPDQEATLRETYDQLLSRAYVNSRGERMMISIAYGSRQTQALRAHRQEVCYAAQGFTISNLQRSSLRVAGAELPVTRMVATQRGRIEPVTYWFTMGDQLVMTYMQREMAQFRYLLSGYVPDGYLVRVSSLSPDGVDAFPRQSQFVDALLQQLRPDLRARLIGHS